MTTSKASALYPNTHKRGADVARELGQARPAKPATPPRAPKAAAKQLGHKAPPVHAKGTPASKLYPSHGLATRKTR